MTKNKILLVFFALVFGFCASSFADVYTDCENNKSLCLAYLSSCTQEVRYISGIAANIVYESTLNGGVHGPSITVDAQEVNYKAVNLNSYLGSVRSLVESVVCSSNDTCSVDLSPIVTLLQNINTVLGYVRSDVQSIKSASQHLEIYVNDGFARLNSSQNEIISSVSNLTDVVSSFDFGSITNLLDKVLRNQVSVYNRFGEFSVSFEEWMNEFWNFMDSYSTFHASALSYISSMSEYLTQYLPYLETIDSSLAYLSSNEYFNVNVNNLSNYLSVVNSSRVAFQNRPYNYLTVTGVSIPNYVNLAPFNNASFFNTANLMETTKGGFQNTILALASLNNYFWWLKTYLPSNQVDVAEILSGLSSLSNTLNRVDGYVLGDFSNQFYKVYSLLDTLVSNQLNSATNNFGLFALIETNNFYTASNTFLLASIDSKLDVLDYIKILSYTPLSEYSGDIDYFDYLTNLYINGSSSSGVASTNWFERMEILLASLVFGDSDGTNGVPQGVHMEGVDSSAVETALTDYSYSSDFTSGIDSLDQTKQNFFQILNSFHQSVKSVSCPASVSIGIGGLDGEDTRDFNDLMHGHFQVSFSVGSSDVFTTVVRSVTTICWVLVFLVIFWKAGFWLLRKMIYLYRVVNRLFWSVFTR